MADVDYNLPDDGTSTPPDPAAVAARAAMMARVAAAGRPDVSAPPAGAPPAIGGQQPMGTLDDLPAGNPPSSWSSRAYHGVLQAMGGKYETQYIPTPTGVVQQQVASTPGQQWKRIIAGGLIGVSGAAAAGTQGPGGGMRGLGGGIQAGMQQRIAEDTRNQKQANTQFDQDQEAAMNKARTSMLAQQKLNLQWEQTRQQMEASRQEIQSANEFEKVIASGGEGTHFVAHAPGLTEAMKITQADPTLHDHHAGGYLQYNDHIDPQTGKHDGVDAYYVTPGLLDSKVPIETTIQVPVTKDGKATFEEHTIPANTMTYRDYFNVNNTLLSQHKDQALIKKTEEETAEMPGKAKAEMAKDYAAADADKARADAYSGKGIQWGNPVAEGTFDPQYPPPQNFPAGTPGIDPKQIGKIPAKIADNRVLAETILENTAAAIKIIQRRPDIFGKLQGRESTAKEWLGTNDKDLAELYTRLDNIARPSVGIHGTRAQSAVDEARVSLMNKFKNGPEATTQALLANVDSARNFIRAAKNYEVYGTEQGPIRTLALHAPATPGALGGTATQPPPPSKKEAPPGAYGVRWDSTQSKYVWVDKNQKDIPQ